MQLNQWPQKPEYERVEATQDVPYKILTVRLTPIPSNSSFTTQMQERIIDLKFQHISVSIDNGILKFSGMSSTEVPMSGAYKDWLAYSVHDSDQTYERTYTDYKEKV